MCTNTFDFDFCHQERCDAISVSIDTVENLQIGMSI